MAVKIGPSYTELALVDKRNNAKSLKKTILSIPSLDNDNQRIIITGFNQTLKDQNLYCFDEVLHRKNGLIDKDDHSKTQTYRLRLVIKKYSLIDVVKTLLGTPFQETKITNDLNSSTITITLKGKYDENDLYDLGLNATKKWLGLSTVKTSFNGESYEPV